MYRIRMISVFCLGISLLVASCGQMAGNMAASGYLATQQDKAVKYPQASNGFQPKKMYNITVDELWASASIVLENNRITLIQMDKQNGRIFTDFIEGQTESKGPAGVMGMITTRYKYDIIIQKVNETTTRLGILCKLQSKSAVNKLTDWHDVSNENKNILVILENWLYEQIENSITNAQSLKKNEIWEKTGLSEIQKFAAGFSGKWIGNYTCGQKPYSHTLNITANLTKLNATADFYPNEQTPKVIPSSYSLAGEFFEDGSFVLRPTTWIKQSHPDYTMDTISGKINISQNELSGRIQSPTCETFHLKK